MEKEELLQVFDENKNMLNESIARSLKTTLTGNKYFMVILAFIENDGKFLIQKVANEDAYGTTGGHVTFKDDGFKTCKKEVKEELGIKLSDEDIEYVDTIKFKNCLIEIYYSTKKIDNDEISLQEEEVESVSWMDLDDINSLIEKNKFRPMNIKALELLKNYKERKNNLYKK